MSASDLAYKLAVKFETSVKKYAQTVSQTGTTELFFGSESTQLAFAKVINDQNSSVGKVLSAYYEKYQKPCSFSLKVKADPGKGAAWELEVSPESLKPSVLVAANIEFKKLMNVSMTDKQKNADASAKSGGGSGVLDIGSLDFS